jgi:predicted RNA binding protein YcfA (HicA-like mRNA interferase family)
VRLPRDLNGRQLAAALAALGYEGTRRSGSHLRLTTRRNGEHHLTIPDYRPLRVGTLAAICEHHRMEREELLKELFG